MSGETTHHQSADQHETTHFAPAERSDRETLTYDIQILGNSAFVDGIMCATGGLLAILNKERQILAVNDAFARQLGIKDVASVFGLRPGEALHCIHAQNRTGGCGTGRFCVTCGAVIAILATLNSNVQQQRECVVTVDRDGIDHELYFLVNCSPIVVEKKRFLLLFLQDVTISQNRAALESVFFHDIQNMISALTLNTKLMTTLNEEQNRQDSQKRIQQIATYLAKEVEMQRLLVRNEIQRYCPEYTEVDAAEILQEICNMIRNHPAAEGKGLDLETSQNRILIVTDLSLLRRVLINMLINAFEATDPGQSIALTLRQEEENTVFEVWNGTPIPQTVALRIFQRHYSTKEGDGRGIGTYSMKLFGETYLGGRVSFTSNPEDGTIFRFALPKKDKRIDSR